MIYTDTYYIEICKLIGTIRNRFSTCNQNLPNNTIPSLILIIILSLILLIILSIPAFCSLPRGKMDPTRAENMADITKVLSMTGSPKGTSVSLMTLIKLLAGEEPELVRL